MSLNRTIRHRNAIIVDYQEMIIDYQEDRNSEINKTWREIDSISKIIMSYE